MATDLMDTELNAARHARWEKAFQTSTTPENHHHRKATLIIEYLMQASNIAHTMQHWHVYNKWNEQLFEELYLAYQNGRLEQNPCEFWYQAEIDFFDTCVIPLAQKLGDCGVLGVSCHEYLEYAKENRAEWERRGQEVVTAMAEKVKAEHT